MTSNSFFTFLGYVAAMLTTFCFLPQLLHTMRTKSVGDLHVGTLILFDLGLLSWLLYGIHLHSWPVILANAVSLALQLVLLGMKLRYGKPSGTKGRAVGEE